MCAAPIAVTFPTSLLLSPSDGGSGSGGGGGGGGKSRDRSRERFLVEHERGVEERSRERLRALEFEARKKNPTVAAAAGLPPASQFSVPPVVVVAPASVPPPAPVSVPQPTEPHRPIAWIPPARPATAVSHSHAHTHTASPPYRANAPAAPLATDHSSDEHEITAYPHDDDDHHHHHHHSHAHSSAQSSRPATGGSSSSSGAATALTPVAEKLARTAIQESYQRPIYDDDSDDAPAFETRKDGDADASGEGEFSVDPTDTEVDGDELAMPTSHGLAAAIARRNSLSGASTRPGSASAGGAHSGGPMTPAAAASGGFNDSFSSFSFSPSAPVPAHASTTTLRAMASLSTSSSSASSSFQAAGEGVSLPVSGLPPSAAVAVSASASGAATSTGGTTARTSAPIRSPDSTLFSAKQHRSPAAVPAAAAPGASRKSKSKSGGSGGGRTSAEKAARREAREKRSIERQRAAEERQKQVMAEREQQILARLQAGESINMIPTLHRRGVSGSIIEPAANADASKPLPSYAQPIVPRRDQPNRKERWRQRTTSTDSTAAASADGDTEDASRRASPSPSQPRSLKRLTSLQRASAEHVYHKLASNQMLASQKAERERKRAAKDAVVANEHAEWKQKWEIRKKELQQLNEQFDAAANAPPLDSRTPIAGVEPSHDAAASAALEVVPASDATASQPAAVPLAYRYTIIDQSRLTTTTNLLATPDRVSTDLALSSPLYASLASQSPGGGGGRTTVDTMNMSSFLVPLSGGGGSGADAASPQSTALMRPPLPRFEVRGGAPSIPHRTYPLQPPAYSPDVALEVLGNVPAEVVRHSNLNNATVTNEYHAAWTHTFRRPSAALAAAARYSGATPNIYQQKIERLATELKAQTRKVKSLKKQLRVARPPQTRSDRIHATGAALAGVDAAATGDAPADEQHSEDEQKLESTSNTSSSITAAVAPTTAAAATAAVAVRESPQPESGSTKLLLEMRARSPPYQSAGKPHSGPAELPSSALGGGQTAATARVRPSSASSFFGRTPTSVSATSIAAAANVAAVPVPTAAAAASADSVSAISSGSALGPTTAMIHTRRRSLPGGARTPSRQSSLANVHEHGGTGEAEAEAATEDADSGDDATDREVRQSLTAAIVSSAAPTSTSAPVAATAAPPTVVTVSTASSPAGIMSVTIISRSSTPAAAPAPAPQTAPRPVTSAASPAPVAIEQKATSGAENAKRVSPRRRPVRSRTAIVPTPTQPPAPPPPHPAASPLSVRLVTGGPFLTARDVRTLRQSIVPRVVASSRPPTHPHPPSPSKPAVRFTASQKFPSATELLRPIGRSG